MAKTVNLGDKYTHRVTLRLSDDQYYFLIKCSDFLGVSPSDYLRMMINAGMVGTRNEIDKIMSGKMLTGEVGTYDNENVKTNSNDFV